MIFTGIQCDNCGKQITVPRHEDPKKQRLADNWLTLYKGDFQQNDPWHFDCLRCLGDWFLKEGTNKLGIVEMQVFARSQVMENAKQEQEVITTKGILPNI